MKDNKKVTSVFVRSDILEHIKINSDVKNLSAWINDRYFDEFNNLDSEKVRFNDLERQMLECKKNIRLLKRQGRTSIIPKVASDWLLSDGLDRLDRFDFKSVLCFFNSEFKLDLSSRQFKAVLKEYDL